MRGRPKVRTPEVDRFIHEEALRRIEYRSNKQIARIVAEQLGIVLSPQYIGDLIIQEAQRIKSKSPRW